MIVVAILVVVVGCTSEDASGAEALRTLRAETIWDELPPGGTPDLFADSEDCEPYGDDTSIWLRVTLGDGGIASATQHYLDVLDDSGWDISKNDVTVDKSSVVAKKQTAAGLLTIQIRGYRILSEERIEVRGRASDAC